MTHNVRSLIILSLVLFVNFISFFCGISAFTNHFFEFSLLLFVALDALWWPIRFRDNLTFREAAEQNFGIVVTRFLGWIGLASVALLLLLVRHLNANS